MKQRQISWNVKMWWSEPGGSFESGANVMLDENMGALEVITEVARLRGVDLAKCHSIEARQTGISLEIEGP